MGFRRICFFLIALCASVGPGVVHAQAQSDATTTPKSGTVATVWALFLPGAGHLYAGETKRGVLLAASTGLTFMYAFTDGRCKRPYTDVRTCELEKNEALGEAAFVTSMALYGFGLWDAHRAARRANARRNLTLGAYELSPQWAFALSRTAEPSLTLRLEFGPQRP